MPESAIRNVRRPGNLSVDPDILAEAKALRINASRAAEAGIVQAVAEEKARLWKAENREAIEKWNDYVERQGLPLEKYRQF